MRLIRSTFYFLPSLRSPPSAVNTDKIPIHHNSRSPREELPHPLGVHRLRRNPFRRPTHPPLSRLRQGPLRPLRPRLRPQKETDRDALADRRSDMWRYFETMPVLDESNIVSLGEGMTPILEAPHLAEAIGATNLGHQGRGARTPPVPSNRAASPPPSQRRRS